VGFVHYGAELDWDFGICGVRWRGVEEGFKGYNAVGFLEDVQGAGAELEVVCED